MRKRTLTPSYQHIHRNLGRFEASLLVHGNQDVIKGVRLLLTWTFTARWVLVLYKRRFDTRYATRAML